VNVPTHSDILLVFGKSHLDRMAAKSFRTQPKQRKENPTAPKSKDMRPLLPKQTKSVPRLLIMPLDGVVHLFERSLQIGGVVKIMVPKGIAVPNRFFIQVFSFLPLSIGIVCSSVREVEVSRQILSKSLFFLKAPVFPQESLC